MRFLIKYKQQFLLVIFLVTQVTFVNVSFGWLPVYNKESAYDYLSKRSHIVLAVKVSGDINFRQYEKLINTYNNDKIDEDTLYNYWAENISAKSHRYILLKNIKGELKRSFELPADTQGIYLTGLGEEVILFVDFNDENTVLGYCNVFLASDFPQSMLMEGSEKEIINYIIENRLSSCLKERSDKVIKQSDANNQ